MATYYRYLNVEFESHAGTKQPDLTSKVKFYKIYSPEALKFDQEKTIA